MIRYAARLVRAGYWMHSKIPPILGVAWIVILVGAIPGGVALAPYCALIASAGLIAAFGHVFNDLWDLEADRRSGSERELERIATPMRKSVALGLLVGGWAPWVLLRPNALPMILLAIEVLLLIAYSVPPVRFKERGVAGLLTDALYAYAIPVLIVVSLFVPYSSSRVSLGALMTIAAGLCGLGLGLRAITRHQVADRERDLKGGVKTWVAGSEREDPLKLVSSIVLPVEVIALIVLARGLFPSAPALSWLMVIWLLVEAVRFLSSTSGRDPQDRSVPLPMAGLYEMWLPITAGLMVVAREPALAGIFVFHLLVAGLGLRGHLRDLRSVVRQLMGSGDRSRLGGSS